MAKQMFKYQEFTDESLKILKWANIILNEYAAQGYDLSLRQLFYQFVSKNLIVNSEASYKRLGDIIANGRNAGKIDWDMIRDRGRSVTNVSTWNSPMDIINGAIAAYKRDLWQDQKAYVMVMVEKQALEGVLEPVCDRLRIAFSANKGYCSVSHLHEIGQHIGKLWENEKDIHVIYLGDHDPSGMDMSRDVLVRLKLYAQTDDIHVHRVALNMNQVETYNPPPNPAKLTDSRASGYIARYGRESWELDALTPTTLADIVTNIVLPLRDEDKWNEGLQREQEEKDRLIKIAKEYKS